MISRFIDSTSVGNANFYSNFDNNVCTTEECVRLWWQGEKIVTFFLQTWIMTVYRDAYHIHTSMLVLCIYTYCCNFWVRNCCNFWVRKCIRALPVLSIYMQSYHTKSNSTPPARLYKIVLAWDMTKFGCLTSSILVVPMVNPFPTVIGQESGRRLNLLACVPATTVACA